MIKYEFLDYAMYSERYLGSLRDTYEIVIDPNYFSYYHKYNVVQHTYNEHILHSLEKLLFSCNDKYELKIWMDLNGFKFNTCKIFYNFDRKIEYASIILRKDR